MTGGKDDEEAAASEVECVRILLCVDALNLKTCHESMARHMENGSLEAARQTPFLCRMNIYIYPEGLGGTTTYCIHCNVYQEIFSSVIYITSLPKQ